MLAGLKRTVWLLLLLGLGLPALADVQVKGVRMIIHDWCLI